MISSFLLKKYIDFKLINLLFTNNVREVDISMYIHSIHLYLMIRD